jgi:hypothetical protein
MYTRAIEPPNLNLGSVVSLKPPMPDPFSPAVFIKITFG